MTTKNYGIAAIGKDVQYGKQGGRIVYDKDNSTFKITSTDGASVVKMKVADGVENDDAVALGQVEGLITSAVEDGVQVELDATQASAGLGTEGQYVPETQYVETENEDGAHYIHTATTLKEADKVLDTQIKQVADDLAALGSGSITDIQDELDLTQAGAGLDTDGNYEELTGSNYLVGATSIHNATSLLDTQIKANADAIDALGTMADQDADGVNITGGNIDGVIIGGSTAADGTFADVTVNGNLTVLGDTTTLDVTNLDIEDNTILLNKGEGGAGVTAGEGFSGIEVDRGTEENARWVWDEATDSWAAQVYNGTSWESASITGNFSGSAVDFGFANTSLVRGDSAELAMGDENQVLTVGTDNIEYSYVDALRDSAGKVTLGHGELNGTGGEFLELATEADGVYLTAKNEAGTGDVDLYLSGQGGGDVIISQNSANQGLIIAEDDTTLTVSGGDSAAGDAGDAILKGGDGSTGFTSGDVILQGGTGGDSEGITVIKDSNGNEVASFEGVDSATDFVTVTNGVGSAELSAQGDSADVDLVLAPKGTGAIVVPAGYDITGAADEAVVNKGYVDSTIGTAIDTNVDPLVMRAEFTADSTETGFDIGTLANVSGKQYFVSRVTLHVATEFAGVDHMVVSDGTAELAAEPDSDITGGTYVVDLPFLVASAGGSTISVQFNDDGAVAAAPSAGAITAVVEYKVV